MPQKTAVTVVHVCARCGYEWTPRKSAGLPVRCAKCRTPLWNVEKAKKENAK